MPQYPWRKFLTEWSREILAEPEYREQQPPEVLASEWLGFPGATEEEQAQLEGRLGRRLPPSYRAFLAVTNGWRLTSSIIPRLLPCAEVDRFAANHRDAVEIWLQYPVQVPDEVYFAYGDDDKGVEGSTRVEYLPSTVQISDIEEAGTAVYLLNPEVIDADGEWEAWFFAHWNPGADRFRSFWKMMRAARKYL